MHFADVLDEDGADPDAFTIVEESELRRDLEDRLQLEPVRNTTSMVRLPRSRKSAPY